MPRTRHNKISTTDLKVALLRRGLSITNLASQLGRSRQAVSLTINGSERFPRVRDQILEAVKWN